MEAKDKLLIIGGSGFLGSNIALMAAQCFDTFITYNSHPRRNLGCPLLHLDIRNKMQVAKVFEEIKPNLVIHTAALVDVDYCESHKEEALAINAEGTRNIASSAKDVKSKMIYISTDSVFDGKHGMYKEDDITSPINVYAKSKLDGEVIVQDLLPDSVIARTAFYGWHPISSNNLSLAEWIVSGARGERVLKMFTDVFFTPIFVNNLAQVLMEMYHQKLNGVYHLGGIKKCSKYDFGQEIAQAFGLSRDCIQPSSIADAGLIAQRPKDISLDISKISKVSGMHMRLFDFQDGVALFRGLEHSLGGGDLYL